MDVGVQSKIAVFVCIICFFQVQCVKFNDGSLHMFENIKDVSQESLKNTVKRSADWSRRISSAVPLEAPPLQLAAESERVEVTSKAPRIIRRMRIQHGGQGVEIFKEINPESRSVDGGSKIVRVKKFKRKPTRKTTTVAPETTTASTTEPTTDNSSATSSSPYSHITVINKEIRNPKKKKKKKKRKNHMTPTLPYDTEAKHNGLMYATEKPDMHQYVRTQQELSPFNTPDSYPYFGSYFKQREPLISNIREEGTRLETEQMGQLYTMPKMDSRYKEFDSIMRRMPQHLLRNANEMDKPSYLPNSMIRNKHDSPMHILSRYPSEEVRNSKSDSSVKENLKESSTQVKEIRNNPEKLGKDTFQADNETKSAIERAGDSFSTLPTVSKEKEIVLSFKEEVNKTESQNSNPESRRQSNNNQIATVSSGRTMIPLQDRFPSSYPSLLYGRQNAFSDPFFDTPEIPSPMHRSGPDVQLLSPWRHPLSPFYSSDNPQREGYLLGDGMHPFQSDRGGIPDFYPSPQLTSLRRSMLDTYGDETTTSEPITHFSLPKFEMPSIDFNDKGCQTVYKEVKTVPGDSPQARNSNAKSFVIARECYFPNGVPTTERTKGDIITETPITGNISENKDLKNDSKE